MLPYLSALFYFDSETMSGVDAYALSALSLCPHKILATPLTPGDGLTIF